MSKEFLKDETVATEWAKVSEPLFTYLAEELKFQDPATFAKMRGTPWLDNKGVDLGQNAKMAKKNKKRDRKRREVTGRMKRK